MTLTPTKRKLLREAAAAELARRDFLSYCVRMEPNFETPRHIEFLAQQLTRLESGACKRLLVACPPRHGKSNLAKLWASWVIGRQPDTQLIYASYSASLAEASTYQIRQYIADEDSFPFPEVRIAPDSRARDDFRTTAGGTILAAGVDSRLTGFGGRIIICDDLVRDYSDSVSAAVTQNTLDWYQSTLSTRAYADSKFLVIGTRFSLRDIQSTLIEGGQFEVVNLPAFAEEDDALGRNVGEPLWPERFPESFLENQRRELGSAHFAALYLQNPISTEGALFQPQWFERRFSFDELPQPAQRAGAEWQRGTWSMPSEQEPLFIVQGCDSSWAKSLASDYSAIVTVATDGHRIFLLDVFRARLQLPALQQMLVAKAQQYRPNAIIVESAASGEALIQQLRGTRLPLISSRPQGSSKEMKWQTIVPLCESGRVLLPKDGTAPWLADFCRELFTVPGSKHDDMVDAFVLAVSYALRLQHSCAQDAELANMLGSAILTP